MKWYIHSGSQQEGPFTVDELKRKFAEKAIHAETFVWTAGMSGWKKMCETQELAEVMSPASRSSVQTDELSVFTELPKAAREAQADVQGTHVGQMKKEVFKAQAIARTSETLKNSKQVLPRIALGLAFLCVVLGGMIAFLSFSKKDLDPIPGIAEADFTRLRAAVVSGGDAPRVEIAASIDDPVHPRIHIASNLPAGTRFSITFRPVPGTVVRALQSAPTMMTAPQRRFHAMTDRFEIPRGEYQVEVSTEGDRKVLASAKYFLGGAKDAEYDSAVAQAQGQRRQKAESELSSIHEAVTMLSSFEELLLGFGVAAGTGQPAAQKKFEELQKQWDDFERSLPQKSIVWQPTSSDLVLSKLVQQARDAWEHSRSADRLYKEYFAKAGATAEVLGKLQDSIHTELNQARDALVLLKAEVDKTHIQEL